MSAEEAKNLSELFWRELGGLRTGMLGLAGTSDAHSQPMTAHFDAPPGPLWFYVRADSPLVAASGGGRDAVFHYTGRGHDLYACVRGTLTASRDQAVIDRFWSDDVARWFPDRNSPQVTLLRFEPANAEIWLPTEGPDARSFKFGSAEDVRAEVKL